MGDFVVYLVKGDIRAYRNIPRTGAAGLALWNLGHHYLVVQ